MKKILLTYGWVRSSYAVLRNLAKHGLDVVVADSKRAGMCQWSKYPVAKYRYTSHYVDESRFVEDIKEICSKEKIDLIVPSHNETEVLARYAEDFTESQRSFFPNPEMCNIFNNKSKSYEKAMEVGLPLPARFNYKDPSDLPDALMGMDNDLFVVKLLTGNSAKGVFYSIGIHKTDALVRKLIHEFDLKSNRYPQIEEYAKGEGWGCSSFYWHGNPVATFCHRRLREKTQTGGTSTYREAAWNQVLVEHTHKLLGSMGWHGFAMVEYKVNPETGEIWFIEVNPRLWGSIPLAINAGVEFPYLAYLCAKEGLTKAIEYQNGNSASRDFKGKWLLGEMAVGFKKILSLRFREAFQMTSERVDKYDDFYWDDPMAFAGEVICYFSNSLTKLSMNPTEEGMLK